MAIVRRFTDVLNSSPESTLTWKLLSWVGEGFFSLASVKGIGFWDTHIAVGEVLFHYGFYDFSASRDSLLLLSSPGCKRQMDATKNALEGWATPNKVNPFDRLMFQPRTLIDEIPHAVVELDLLEDAPVNANVVILRFFGKPLSKRSINNLVLVKWKIESSFSIDQINKYVFKLSFSTKRDTMKATRENWDRYGSELFRMMPWTFW